MSVKDEAFHQSVCGDDGLAEDEGESDELGLIEELGESDGD